VKNPKVQDRFEKAGEKARKVQKKLDLVKYIIDDNGILLTSGPYTGQYVIDVWKLGPVERDYVIKNLWFRNDEQVNQILHTLCCK
jgi:hypothetical protein